jgi:hypothetical protein
MRPHQPVYVTRLRPISAGAGFRFIKVGELIRRGDEFFAKDGKWVKTTKALVVCSVEYKNLYRRREHVRSSKGRAS